MKRKAIVVVLTSLLTLMLPVTKAFAISSNGGTMNTQMNNNMGNIIDSTTVDGWHSSGGYWRFNYNDWNSSFSVNDSDVPNYFSGTAKTFNENLVITRNLPQAVKDFIRVYGKDKVGIKITVGKDGSILNNAVSYTLTDTTIKLSFRPILRYNRYNMWQYHNSGIWNSMTRKVHTPEVTSGYGENYVSVRDGAVGMLLNPSIMRSAYKASDGKLRFTSGETTTLGDGTTTIAKNEYALNNFFSGGSSGVYFRYPINIQFYDINVSASSKVSNVEYLNGSTYWVKSGDDFTIETKGIPSGNDNLVRPTQNTIQIDSNGATQLIDMRKTASSSTVQQSGTNGENFVNFNSNKISSNTEGNGTFNANINVSIDGDKDITISSMTSLNNFQNGNWDTSKLYKTSPWTGKISVKSDSQAPNVSEKPSANWTKDNVSINLNVTDTRSGVKASTLYKGTTQVATGSGNINYTEKNEGVHEFKISTSDNVGNTKEEKFTIKIDKTAPSITGKPSSDWTKDNVKISLNANDGNGSGVKNITLYKGETQVATGTTSLNYTESNEGIHTYKVRSEDNVGNVKEETFTVKIDKTAPNGKVSYDYNDTNADFKITVKDIVEEGSGVNRIWVEYSPKNNPSRVVSENLVSKGSIYETEKNLNDLFPDSTDIISMTVKAIDNVGNERVLSQNEIDVFLVSANIERVLEPNTPVFKNGEKGILKIKLFNGVEKVKITFPSELSKLDESLNTEIILEPKKTDTIDYEFFVPLDTPSKAYRVQVIGYKNGKEKEVYPSFEVEGSILNQIRTRIRIR